MKCILLSINELWIVYKDTKDFIPVFREILIPLYFFTIRIRINKKRVCQNRHILFLFFSMMFLLPLFRLWFLYFFLKRSYKGIKA